MTVDDLSFFDDPGTGGNDSPSPSPFPSAEGTDASASQATQISAEQFADMQRRLESAERWRNDAVKFFGGQDPNQTQQPDPQALLQQFLTNPAEVLQQTTQQAVVQAQEAYRNQAIIEDRRAKNPELAKIEPLIDWDSAMKSASQAFYQANNRVPSFAEALDGAIANIKNTFQGTLPSAQGAPSNGVNNQMVMSLGVNGSHAGNTQPVDLSAIPDADWPKYREAYRRSRMSN